MTSLRSTLQRRDRRLRTAVEAAAYCGAPSLEKWRAVCGVKPFAVYPGRAGERFDVADLDRWIGEMKGSGLRSVEDWLEALDHDGGKIEGR